MEELIEEYDVDEPSLRRDVLRKLPPPPESPTPPVAPPQMGEEPARVAVGGDPGLSAVDLPATNAGKPVVLTGLGEVKSVEILNPLRQPRKFSIEAGKDGGSWTITLRGRKVAHLRRGAGADALTFTWVEGLLDEADSLRNAVLVVTGSESTTIALRRAVEMQPPVIDLGKIEQSVAIDVPLWAQHPKALRIEGVDFDGRAHNGRFPPNGRADHNQPVRLALRGELPRAGVELSLHGSAPFDLRLKPILEDFDGRLYPWTEERLRRLAAAVTLNLTNLERDIPKLQDTIRNLEAQLQELQRQPTTAYNALSLPVAKKLCSAAIESAKGRLQAAQTALPIVKSRLKAFDELRQLTNGLKGEVRVRFRVFYDVGQHEVTVVRAGAVGSEN
jgi:hypothetical protein